jgi:hypothetical protein
MGVSIFFPFKGTDTNKSNKIKSGMNEMTPPKSGGVRTPWTPKDLRFCYHDTEEKDLGVIINSNFKVLNQCIKAAKKGNQILSLIKRTITCRSNEISLSVDQSKPLVK